jgi:hypothetical protein
MAAAESVRRALQESRPRDSFWKSPAVVVFCLVALVGTGVARIASTYHVFNQIFDEPCHLASGMEWWDQGRYQYERQHPPLSRIAIALGPYLDGLHSLGHEYTPAGYVEEGNDILYSRNTYWRNLTLARMGILPFFIAASLLVWFWSDRVFGRPTAWAATFLFTTLQPVLGHSGIATTDMALTACLGLALYAFTIWWERPGMRQTVGLGVAVALAVLSKFTTFLFLPVSVLSIIAVYAISTRTPLSSLRENVLARSRSVGIALAIALVFIWGMYRFSFTRPLKPGGYDRVTIANLVGAQGRLHDLATAIAGAPMPLGELFAGLASVAAHGKAGHDSYLLGVYSPKGWWYYFPVAFALKTPLPFLVLIGVGVVMLFRRRSGEITWKQWAPLCSAASIMLICLPSSIAIGIRHILPMYLLLSMVAGYGLATLFASAGRRKGFAAAGGLLLLWQGAASLAAHPNYLAYFNEIAARRPERFLSDSNLDWGQDLQRLSVAARARGIHDLTLSYFGTALPARHGLPALHPFIPYRRTDGWIAVSIFNLKVDGPAKQRSWGAASSPYDWLQAYQPVERVGQSIELYYVPQDAGAPPAISGRYSGVRELSVSLSNTLPGRRTPETPRNK